MIKLLRKSDMLNEESDEGVYQNKYHKKVCKF